MEGGEEEEVEKHVEEGEVAGDIEAVPESAHGEGGESGGGEGDGRWVAEGNGSEDEGVGEEEEGAAKEEP